MLQVNPLSSELPFHVHNWLIISLKDYCIVIRKWLTSWLSAWYLDWRKCGKNLALCYLAVVMELFNSLWMNCKSEFGVYFFFQKKLFYVLCSSLFCSISHSNGTLSYKF